MPRAYKNTWDKGTYNFYDLTKKHKAVELKSEWKKMKKETERRLKSLERSKNETAQNLAAQYRDILKARPRNKKQLAKAIMASEKFLSLQSSKVTYIYKTERKILASLHDRGYDFITKRNLKKFGDFMDFMRAQGYDTKYDSTRIMEFLAEKRQVLVDVEKLKDEFERWSEENG